MLCYKALVYVLSFKPACAERPPTWLIRFTSTLKKNKKHDNQTAFAGSEKKKSFKSGRNAMLHTVQFLLKAWQAYINHINHTLI